ncbi:MAG: hypothetical protein ACTHOU_15825 [Aureliella sp.]|jgi:hypothetical protein
MASDCISNDAFGPASPCSMVAVSASSIPIAAFADAFKTQRRAVASTFAFWLCCLIVAAVSVHDAALVVLNHEVISDFERNPVGKWLLDVQGGDVWLFVLVKLAGTALVCAVLITVFQYCRRYGIVSAAALASFQIGLLCYLTMG